MFLYTHGMCMFTCKCCCVFFLIYRFVHACARKKMQGTSRRQGTPVATFFKKTKSKHVVYSNHVCGSSLWKQRVLQCIQRVLGHFSATKWAPWQVLRSWVRWKYDFPGVMRPFEGKRVTIQKEKRWTFWWKKWAGDIGCCARLWNKHVLVAGAAGSVSLKCRMACGRHWMVLASTWQVQCSVRVDIFWFWQSYVVESLVLGSLLL